MLLSESQRAESQKDLQQSNGIVSRDDPIAIHIRSGCGRCFSLKDTQHQLQVLPIETPVSVHISGVSARL
jgi:hypothetical protein